MKIEYKYIKDKNYVLSKPNGIATLQDVISYTEELYNDTDINSPFYEIVDFEHIENFDFGYFESDQLIECFIKLKSSKGYLGSCLVASEGLSKGMSHIFKVIGEDLGISIKIFDSLDSAINYVEKEYSFID